jgi:hypothetical protein
MAGERLPARFSLRSQLWFRWTGKCFETATSHMQTVGRMPGQIGKKILTNGKNNGCQQRLYPMLTESEIRRISKLETKKQARLSEVKVGGVGQPRGAGFWCFLQHGA